MMSLQSSSFLFEWFGIHGGREIFIKNHRTREFINTSEQLENYTRDCKALKSPCFVSVQPYRDRNSIFGLEKLFFDFDCKENPGKAWKDVTKFAHILRDYYGLKSLVTFSGRKGYHLYVWLWSTVQIHTEREEFIKNVYDGLQKKLLKGLKFETLDPNPLGDIKRLARLPYSIHEETGKVCQPINLKHEPITIPKLEEYRRHGLDSRFLEKVCKEVKIRDKIKIPRFSKTFKSSGEVRPCIEAAIHANLESETGHKMRLAIACEYLNNGKSIEETATLFQGQPDYGNGLKSHYFVKDAKAKGYKPFKCSTISQLGFCLREKCAIWKRRLS